MRTEIPPFFYEVSGERKTEERTFPKSVRFSSIYLAEAERFATDVYKREGLVCEIHEITR
jgi:hypothetical protein